jgi:3-oxoacyl-[acyl-carrier protein] reductase
MSPSEAPASSFLPSFSGDVAIVTGAGQGIGFEISRQLALKGCSVVLNDLDPGLASEAAARIGKSGGKCHPIAGDVSDLTFLQRMVDQTVSQFGLVSLLAANAGITLFGDFFTYPVDSFQRVMDVNLKGTFFLTQAVANQMRRQGQGGRIVLTSSVTGHQAHKDLTAYGMTKAALEMLARSLVVELSPWNITINAVAPGATLTERTQHDEPDYGEIWSRLTPMGRAARPEDIAQAVLFLLSREATHITGQSLVVDGGWSVVSPQPE